MAIVVACAMAKRKPSTTLCDHPVVSPVITTHTDHHRTPTIPSPSRLTLTKSTSYLLLLTVAVLLQVSPITSSVLAAHTPKSPASKVMVRKRCACDTPWTSYQGQMELQVLMSRYTCDTCHNNLPLIKTIYWELSSFPPYCLFLHHLFPGWSSTDRLDYYYGLKTKRHGGYAVHYAPVKGTTADNAILTSFEPGITVLNLVQKTSKDDNDHVREESCISPIKSSVDANAHFLTSTFGPPRNSTQSPYPLLVFDILSAPVLRRAF